MFRNPRENANRDSSSPLQPSVGRPPSPPAQGTTPCLSAATQGRRYSAAMAKTQTLADAAAKANIIQPSPRQTPAKKAATKSNSSILSFFKKQDPDNTGPILAETLFVEDKRSSSRDNTATRITNQDIERVADDDTRFNESDTPVKRRKTSYPPEETRGVALSEQSSSATGKVGNGIGNHANGGEVTPPSRRQSQRIGPFVDESDSDDEAMQSHLSTRNLTNDGDEQADHEVDEKQVEEPKKEREGSSTESNTPQHWQDDDGNNDDDDDDDDDENMTRNCGRPRLTRQATSIPEQAGFDAFEGIEDFDDEYEEGEEFVERKWMEEQRRIEAAEIDKGQEDALKVQAIPACPICEASFAGVSDQEASVHVNHCLDGNPTPLPTTDKVEPKPEDEQQVKQYERPVRAPKPGQPNPFELGNANGTSSAFSKMMSGNAEDTAWAAAAAAENASRGKPAYTRTCPFYKILPGLFICVDAFRYGAVQGCNAYFLSHFHSDHYIGLTSSWRHGPIYCSRPTANLVKQQLKVDPKYVVALEFEEKVEVPNTNGVFVTMIPANHCPGSSLFLYEKVIGKGQNPKVQRILHCGDFRACPAHVEHPLLKPEVRDAVTGKTAQQRIDVCYLDTTYLNPRYAFPSQEDVIKACADMCVSLNKPKADKEDAWEQAKRERAGGSMAKFVRPDTGDIGKENDEALKSKDRGQLLVVVGTYSIGKERICLGIARALGSKIYAPPGKQRICAALEDQELNSRLTSDPREAQVHMTPLFEIRADTLDEYLAEYKDRFSRAVGFRPSGWNYRPPGSRFTESPSVSTVLYSDNWKTSYTMKELVPQRGSTSRTSTFGVPYSEHSSFRELTMFCCALRIDKIIPTVNIGSAKGRERMKLWCERWAVERKKSGFFHAGVKEEGYRAWFPGKGTMDLMATL